MVYSLIFSMTGTIILALHGSKSKMFYFKLFFGFLYIISTLSINNALKMEEIIGSYPSSQTDFKYQAAIVGKYNLTYPIHLFCSAGIISDYLLISAARCFIQTSNELKKLTFYAVLDADTLIAKRIILKEIEKIYTYNYNIHRTVNDLAITRLKESLNILNRSDLAALKIPDEEDNFLGQTGIVAGFGIDSIDKLKKYGNRERIQLATKYGLQLRHADVIIISDGEFRQFDNEIHNVGEICGEMINQFDEICGIIFPDETYPYRGVCKGDIGAPLVINNTVAVGIVSKRNPDCDDTVHGSLYTKISRLKKFTDAVMEETDLKGIKTYTNLPHIPHPKYLHTSTATNL